MSEGFFSRWSRRKLDPSEPAQPPEPRPVPSASAAAVAAPALAPTQNANEALDRCLAGDRAQPPAAVPAGQAEPELPTLQDVQALTPQSDFQPFMRPGVGAEVRNAAMKKLFADPHFNVMDGLDVYIDDYSQPDPMPSGMLRQMASAQFMGLVPPEQTERHLQDPVGSAERQGQAQVVAQSPDSSAAAEPTHHDHPDLQLQPDPAPADPSPGPSPG